MPCSNKEEKLRSCILDGAKKKLQEGNHASEIPACITRPFEEILKAEEISGQDQSIPVKFELLSLTKNVIQRMTCLTR